jgi:serine protease inhibitor
MMTAAQVVSELEKFEADIEVKIWINSAERGKQAYSITDLIYDQGRWWIEFDISDTVHKRHKSDEEGV